MHVNGGLQSFVSCGNPRVRAGLLALHMTPTVIVAG